VAFAQAGWTVAGLDPNIAAIERARALLPIGRFFTGTVDAIPDDELFDVIRADNVFEHLLDPLEILVKLRRHLLPDGRVMLYVPSGECLSLRLLRGGSVSSWIPFHITLFSRRGIETMLMRAGFRVERLGTYSPLAWWKLTARQIVSSSGWGSRKPSLSERVAMALVGLGAPLWLLASYVGLGEELYVIARNSGGHDAGAC
jgi:SAM-dependent methyltransferase